MTKKSRKAPLPSIHRLGLIFLIFSLASTACSAGNNNNVIETTPLSASEQHTTSNEQPKHPIPAPQPVTSKATLLAVGDVLIHSSIYRDAQTPTGYDFTPMFQLVKPFISQADIAMANQETMIGGAQLGLSHYPRFNSPYEVGDALKEAGFDIVSLANNHTLDRGEQAIRNAISHWNKLGMAYIGAYLSDEDRNHIRTIERNGIIFSFLAYTYGTNGIPIPNGKDYLVNLIDPAQMKQDIKQAEQISDVVVISLHFGNEYQQMPDENQTNLTQELANYGADIIIGHHPHVLQPAEWITRTTGATEERTFVTYSLGNFLAAQNGPEKEIGGLLQITVEKTENPANGETSIRLTSPEFIPTVAYKYRYRNYQIIPLHQTGDKRVGPYQIKREEVRQHMSQWMPELNIR